MDILRFITAGNVDDGKSTLIGRLLYDTKNIKDDVLASVTKPDGNAAINLAFITDGLRAEREQGITIDVAYKYFTTPTRKYIITDAPGHFQYTKNLVTGASNVDAIIILIDALNGITHQTLRHSQVAAFLGIKNVVVAINKMDAQGYDESVFSVIKNEYQTIAHQLGLNNVTIMPISALMGDNVLEASATMRWYTGVPLMDWLAQCTPKENDFDEVRLSIQCAIAAPQEGLETVYAGKLLSGTLQKGDTLQVHPGGATVTIAKILHGYNELNTAQAGDNIVVYLCEPVHISRGALLSGGKNINTGNQLSVTICWLNDQQTLQAGAPYILRINATETLCRIENITGKFSLNTLKYEPTSEPVSVNDFVKAVINLDTAIAYDAFATLPENGRGILIDPTTNYTSAAFTID